MALLATSGAIPFASRRKARALLSAGATRIVGFDDLKYAGLLGVPLTTLHQPCRENVFEVQ